jgi:F420-non-reducing hydrogenase small subunit
MSKPKIAFYWCASCGGCEEAVLDLAEAFLDVAARVEVVFWPVALDFKTRDFEALDDGSVDAAFVNGGVRTSEQEEMAHLLRRKARLLVAFGSCAHLGGIPGLANLCGGEAVLHCVYEPNGAPSEGLPRFFEMVRPLDQVVDVDYYVPGCPPTPKIIAGALEQLLGETLPAKHSVLAPDQALCEECPRRDSRPDDLKIDRFRRPHEIVADTERCLLAQGLLCLGAATRAGCGAACVQGNMPCTGCFGPTTRVRDFGAKALSGLASILSATTEEEIDAALRGIPDPAGTFYRYSLPASLWKRESVAAR